MKRLFSWTVVFGILFAGYAKAIWAAEPKLRWLGHAAFQFTTRGGKVLLIDPWLTNPKAPKDATPARLDAVLITHGHSDHVGEGFELAKKFNAPVIASYELTEIAKKKGVMNVMPLNPNGSARIENVTITAVPAVHSSSYLATETLASPPGSSGGKEGGHLIYAGAPLGFVVAEDGSPAFYHAGDTGVFSDMAMISELYSPQIALLPIGGIYTMKPAEAAIAARNLQVRTVVPMHYGTFPALAGTPEELAREMRRRGIPTTLMVLKPGQTIDLKTLASGK